MDASQNLPTGKELGPCCGQFDVAQFGEQLSTEIWTPVFGPPRAGAVAWVANDEFSDNDYVTIMP